MRLDLGRGVEYIMMVRVRDAIGEEMTVQGVKAELGEVQIRASEEIGAPGRIMVTSGVDSRG